MRILICFLLLSACSRSSTDSAALYAQTSSQPSIAILAIEDEACTFSSLKIADLLTSSVIRCVEQNKPFEIVQEKRAARYHIKMQLVELQESDTTPHDLTMSILLKILDTRNGKVLLQEVLSVNTLLDEPLGPSTALSQNNAEFRISPLGLGSAKLSRKIATRIEESILSQVRTS